MAKADTYKDEWGRRRVDRDRSRPDGQPDTTAQLAKQLAALKTELAQLRADFEALTITGPGFSGSGSRIKFNPSLKVTASLDCDATPPTLTVGVDF